MKKVVVTEWRCKKLNQKIKTSEDAIFFDGEGWICDCGQWTQGKDKDHTAISDGAREIYER